MNIIYIITTEGCAACRIMQGIIEKLKEENLYDYDIKIVDYKKVPEWISTDVVMTDFPITVFTKNDVIKFVINGTYPKSEVKDIVNTMLY